MNILFCSSAAPSTHRRGSWIVRGEQLAAEMGAQAVLNPATDDIAKADAVIVVKRASVSLLGAIRKARKRLIFDVIDGWAQPTQSRMTQQEAAQWLRKHIAAYAPHAVVHTTSLMRDDAHFKGRDIVLPHHGWRRDTNQIREKVETVGYEGCAAYLQEWQSHIETECAQRGWRFVINPSGGLAAVDIAVAFRGGKYDGVPSRRWKSNIKIANAQITGTPIIALPEAGATEFRSGGELFAENPYELADRFDLLTSHYARQCAAKQLLARAQRIEAIAPAYRRWIEDVCA